MSRRWAMAGIMVVALVVLPTVLGGPIHSASAAPSDEFRAWWNVSHGPAPPAAAGNMMAYDGAVDRFVYFGGWNGSVPLNGTWLLDPANGSWSPRHPAIAPLARADAAMVYDPVDDLVYLFGGWAQYANGTIYRLNDTWSYSVGLDAWTELPNGEAPSPRSDSGITFDPTGGVVLLFGGFSGTVYLGGTWSYDPDRHVWSQLTVAGPSPGNRADGRLSFDPALGASLLFAGNDFSGPNLTFHHLNDTWRFNYTDRTWSRVATASSPPARDYAIQGVDPRSGWLIVFSGYGNRTILNDLWAFAPGNATWWPIALPSPPPPRYAGTGGFEDAGERFVAFGGAGNTGLLNDTWTLNGTPAPTTGGTATGSLLVLVAIGPTVGAIAVVAAVGLRQRGRRRD
ncbi:MAG TPA: kelch repeat-containing protein [Thermoplasmata archaeon]|nr:kelch repeat-containing protein [Thermoplasmata archaeon]